MKWYELMGIFENASHYEILGVSNTATSDEIKKAYHKKSREYHPDLYQQEPNYSSYEESFKKVNEAYSELSDPIKRAEYDNIINHQNDIPDYTTNSNENVFSGLAYAIEGVIDGLAEGIRNKQLELSLVRYTGISYNTILAIVNNESSTFDNSFNQLIAETYDIFHNYRPKSQRKEDALNKSFNLWLYNYCKEHRLEISISKDNKYFLINNIKLYTNSLFSTYIHLMIIEIKTFFQRQYIIDNKQLLNNQIIKYYNGQFQKLISTFAGTIRDDDGPSKVNSAKRVYEEKLKSILNNFLYDYCDSEKLEIRVDNGVVYVEKFAIDLSESFQNLCLKLNTIKYTKDTIKSQTKRKIA